MKQKLIANRTIAEQKAQDVADQFGCSALLHRRGWYLVSEEPPDELEAQGWTLVGLFDDGDHTPVSR